MRNKKAILASTFVGVIVLAIVFFVIIRFYSGLLALAKGLFEGYFGCLFKKVISAYTKTPFLETEVWGSFCAPLVMTITLTQEGDGLVPIDVSFTNEPNIRLFNGYEHGESITEEIIQRSDIQHFRPGIIPAFDRIAGYFLFGIKDDA